MGFGGIEWNFPDGHTLTTVAPIDYVIRTEPDGSAAVAIGDTERVQGMQWQVILRCVPEDGFSKQKSHLTIAARFQAGTGTGPLRVLQLLPIYASTIRCAKRTACVWPVFKFPKEKGVDIGRLARCRISSRCLRVIRSEIFGVYYEQADWGVVHVADIAMPGKDMDLGHR